MTTPTHHSARSLTPRDRAAEAIDAIALALPVSVAMTDLDGFADLNDTHGRAAGDAILGGFDHALEHNLPDDAIVHRIGGDEWVLAFPGVPLENCVVLLEELRGHIAATTFGADEHRITMTGGIAARPPHGTTGDELIRLADEALSRAKRDGRDRIGIYVEDKMVMKSNYYSRATLDRIAALSRATNRTEASLLREAADRLLAEYADLT